MKALMIVARDSMVTEVEKLLDDNGIKTYSTIRKVRGKDLMGRRRAQGVSRSTSEGCARQAHPLAKNLYSAKDCNRGHAVAHRRCQVPNLTEDQTIR